jgi:hypothetical protein
MSIFPYHIIARYRQQNLRAIFRDAKNQTLQLLFPDHDVGFCYTSQGTAHRIGHATPANPFEYSPHFALVDA